MSQLTYQKSQIVTLLQHRFVILLIVLLLLFIIAPLTGLLTSFLSTRVLNSIMSCAFAAIMLSIIYAATKTKRSVLIAVFLFAGASILQILYITLGNDVYLIGNHFFTLIFIGYAVVKILGLIFTNKKVTIDTICASICAYVLIALFWALMYSINEIIYPGSFAISGVVTGPGHQLRFYSGQNVMPIYYSIVTLSTLGYGDIIPYTNASRMLAAVEALFGQFYIAVLVARLVGIHIADAANSRA